MNVTIFGIDYECTKAVKGFDFVHLYQGDTVILSCLGITDFSGYALTDGEWSDPDPDLDVVATGAALSNGSIVITSDKIIGTGTMLKFKAPCDCTAVTKGLVIDKKTYAIVDSLGSNVLGKGGMWASGAFVSVLIDKANLRAFVQNSAKPAVVLGIKDGGTGATDVIGARKNLGIDSKIGDIITTRRTDLGEHWALCNGDYMDAYKAPELYRMSRESYEYDIVHELEGKLEFEDDDWNVTTVNGSVVVNNTVYSAVMDVPNSKIYVYKWVGDDKSYEPVLHQTILYTTRGNTLYMTKCADWVFIEVGYDATYSAYSRAFLAANIADMEFYPISYLTEGNYAFNNGVGDSGSGISTSDSTFVYCKIKSDGTMGIVMTYIDNYSNSSGTDDRYRMNVLELVDGKWMCVKALTTNYFIPYHTTVSVAPFYNPYLGLWQICVQSNDNTFVYLHSIDIVACYESGVLTNTSSAALWSRYDSGYVYGVAYDTGSAIWLIPDCYDKDDFKGYAKQIDGTDKFTSIREVTWNSYVDTLRIYNGKIYGFTSMRSTNYGVKVFDTIDELIDNAGTVLTDNSDYPMKLHENGITRIHMPTTDDIAFDQGLYDHVFTGDGVQTPGYLLPSIAPDKAYAYIKIKEGTDA